MIVLSKSIDFDFENGFDDYNSIRYQMRTLNLDQPCSFLAVLDDEMFDVFYAGSQLHVSIQDSTHVDLISVGNKGRRFSGVAEILDKLRCSNINEKQVKKLFNIIFNYIGQAFSLGEAYSHLITIEKELLDSGRDKEASIVNNLYTTKLLEVLAVTNYDNHLVVRM